MIVAGDFLFSNVGYLKSRTVPATQYVSNKYVWTKCNIGGIQFPQNLARK
jgi:hypothetical protein